MISLNLNEDIENKLHHWAKRSGKTEERLVEEALREYLEELDDVQLAEERIENPKNRTPMEDLLKDFGLDD